MAACRYHSDRPGIGVCMRCRAVICAACCTRVDGVNHCHACLKALAGDAEPAKTADLPVTLSALLVLGMCWLFFFGLAFLVEGRVQ